MNQPEPEREPEKSELTESLAEAAHLASLLATFRYVAKVLKEVGHDETTDE